MTRPGDSGVHERLIDRIAGPVTATETVLVIGSGLTTPTGGYGGVPGTGALVELIEGALSENRRGAATDDFRACVEKARNKYQAAFEFALDGDRGNLGAFARRGTDQGGGAGGVRCGEP